MILSFVLLLMLTSCGADLCGYVCRYYSDANVILISLLCVCGTTGLHQLVYAGGVRAARRTRSTGTYIA
jgi:hypothetical protein